jgi:hypothetical protein
VELGADRNITIWDAPPKNFDVERIFPNSKTHTDPTVRAVQVGAGRHCYGTKFGFEPEFPLVMDEGPGNGKASVVATLSIEDQPRLEDYQIPGRTLNSAAKPRTFDIAPSKTCDEKMKAVVDYQVR